MTTFTRRRVSTREKERAEILAHHTMCLTGGFFGIYAILTRGGYFGSAETSNLLYLVIYGLDGSLLPLLLRLGAVVCYLVGIIFTTWGKRFLPPGRLRYCALLVDTAACLLLARIPPETDPLLSLYPMFFATSIHWLAYDRAAGFHSATTFSTNNLRQCAEGILNFFFSRDKRYLQQANFFAGTLLCFHAGAAYGWFCIRSWHSLSIYACLPLLALGLLATLRNDQLTARSSSTVN